MSDMARGLVDEYQLIHAAPTVEEYLELRERSGLTPRTLEQAAVGLQGSWAACHIVYEPAVLWPWVACSGMEGGTSTWSTWRCCPSISAEAWVMRC